MTTTVDLGKVTGPQGPQGDSYITKYVVNSSNKSVTLPAGVYAVRTSISDRQQIIVRFDGITSVESLCAHKNLPEINYGMTTTVDSNRYINDLIVLEQDNTANAVRARGTSSVTFYKIA